MPDNTTPTPDPVEFSVEDAMLNTWVEDTGDYLQIDAPALAPPVEPPDDSI